MVEETVEDIEESLDWFLWIWGDLPLTSLLITGLVPVDWSISVLLKVFTEGKRVRWLLDWIVELKGVGKLNLFAVSPIGATIQDGGKRKRSVLMLNSYVFVLRSTCIAHIVWHYPFNTFYILLYVLWLVTMLSDVTDVWCCDLVTLILVLRIEIKINWKENKNNLESTAFSFDKEDK